MPREPHPCVLAALDGFTICRIWDHAELPGPIASPLDFCKAIGAEPGQVAKTLLLGRRCRARDRAAPSDFVSVTIGHQCRVDLRRLASTLEWSGCELASEAECASLTGYPRWGMSPLGLKLRVFFDDALLDYATIMVGGGAVGVEVELPPRALCDLTAATTMALRLG